MKINMVVIYYTCALFFFLLAIREVRKPKDKVECTRVAYYEELNVINFVLSDGRVIQLDPTNLNESNDE